jgi:hypothetical protein
VTTAAARLSCYQRSQPLTFHKFSRYCETLLLSVPVAEEDAVAKVWLRRAVASRAGLEGAVRPPSRPDSHLAGRRRVPVLLKYWTDAESLDRAEPPRPDMGDGG